MSSQRTRIRLLVVAWLLLVGGAVAVGVAAEQNDLGPKAEDALAAAGIEAKVEVSGRDVTVTGSAADRTAAEDAIAGIEGVRVVKWVDASSEAAATAPTTTVAPAVTTRASGGSSRSASSPTSMPCASSASTIPVRHQGVRTTDTSNGLRWVPM